MTITSRDNRIVKEVRRLLADAKYRRETGLFALEGARLCADAAVSGVKIRTVLYTRRAAEGYPAQMERLRQACAARSGEALVEISEEIARHMGDTMAPQGIFCVCEALDNAAALVTIKGSGRYAALEDLQDPGNLGAVVRTAEALGLDGLFLSSGCCDIYNPKVLRASMGGVFRLPIRRVEGMTGTVEALQSQGLTCWACVVDADAVPVQRAGLGAGSVCLIGNEGSGLRPETASACRGRLTIPMAGRAESLNASMAAGIVLWEMMRG